MINFGPHFVLRTGLSDKIFKQDFIRITTAMLSLIWLHIGFRRDYYNMKKLAITMDGQCIEHMALGQVG